MDNENKPLSVSEYIAFINGRLAECSAKVMGEISEVKESAKGHVYFTLKDKRDNGIMECVIWGYNYRISGVKLAIGAEVVVTGEPNIYAPWGKFSFKVQSVELVGEGALKKAYDELKRKLESEGVFAPEKKRPMPEYPQTIGVVTSLHGAVIHDFSNNLGKFGFKVMVMDARVEGSESARDIFEAIRSFKKKKIDVLVVMRGGGSMQSLAGFDNEMVVRAIAGFPVPVVAGIGHHQDVSLAALAADAMVSTPTAAAHLMNESWERVVYAVREHEVSISTAYERVLSEKAELVSRSLFTVRDVLKSVIEKCGAVLAKAAAQTRALEQSLKSCDGKIDGLGADIKNGFGRLLSEMLKRLDTQSRIIEAYDPERQLALGYSVVFRAGKVVRAASELNNGDDINILLKGGEVAAEIKKQELWQKKQQQQKLLI